VASNLSSSSAADDTRKIAEMYYGFDIGGSKIALGVFNQERRLQWEKRVAAEKQL
jgi:predicted NBD/HSP70 family sugar kinase